MTDTDAYALRLLETNYADQDLLHTTITDLDHNQLMYVFSALHANANFYLMDDEAVCDSLETIASAWLLKGGTTRRVALLLDAFKYGPPESFHNTPTPENRELTSEELDVLARAFESCGEFDELLEEMRKLGYTFPQ